MKPELSHLLGLAQQVVPSLSCINERPSNQVIVPGEDNRSAVEAIYSSLATAHPEAGERYYQARTWSLLTWQPVYLAFISVYCLKSVPSKLSNIIQTYQTEMVAGYYLEPQEMIETDIDNLVNLAGAQLLPLAGELLASLQTISSFKTSIAQKMLLDVVGEVLTFIKNHSSHLPMLNIRVDDLNWHLEAWLKAMNLPLRSFNKARQIIQNEPQGELVYQRVSCCFDFKKKDTEYCGNCPKAFANNRVTQND